MDSGLKPRRGDIDLLPLIKSSFPGFKIAVTFTSKISAMKKILVAVVLLGSITAVAFASLNNNKKKAGIEKKTEKKKECSRVCDFS
jgi:hypothetical protein